MNSIGVKVTPDYRRQALTVKYTNADGREQSHSEKVEVWGCQHSVDITAEKLVSWLRDHDHECQSDGSYKLKSDGACADNHDAGADSDGSDGSGGS